MRDLSVCEIEMVSGAGFSDWFGGVTEQIQNWFSQLSSFIAGMNIPAPTQQQIDLVQSTCMHGVSSVIMTGGGGSGSVTISGTNGAILMIANTGGFTFTCEPNP